MGIPSYFMNIVKHNPHIIQSHVSSSCLSLFIDMNSIIHHCTQNALKELTTKISEQAIQCNKHQLETEAWVTQNKQALYNKLCHASFVLITDYLVYIVGVAKPTQLVYIAMDGVAPMGKIQQQRKRRYRTHKDRLLKQQIYQKYNVINLDDLLWDSNVISPATSYMMEVSTYLKKHLKSSLVTNPLFSKLTILFSDTLVQGEGEHKILQYLRQQPPSQSPSPFDDSSYHVIYGLDADLIMLSLSLPQHSIYLLRETLEYGTKIVYKDPNHTQPVMLYLNVNELRQSIVSKFSAVIVGEEEETYAWIQDYIFLCFLFGNDFLPHHHILHIVDNDINKLVELYIMVYKNLQQHLVHTKNNMLVYNIPILNELFKLLAMNEDKGMMQYLMKMIKYRHYDTTNRHNSSIFEKELENLQYIQKHERHLEKQILRAILTSSSTSANWRNEYYESVGGLCKTNEYDQMIVCYLQGLNWCLQYYFNHCPSGIWYYSYEIAPTFYDMTEYIQKTDPMLLERTIFDVFTSNRVYHQQFVNAYEQQLLILPPSSFTAFPPVIQQALQDDLSLLYYFPEDFEVIGFCKRFKWECQPVIPLVNLQLISTFVKRVLQQPPASSSTLINVLSSNYQAIVL